MPVSGSVARGNSKNLVKELLGRAGVELDGNAPSDLQIHDERFFDRVVKDRELGLGETYQQGWWSAGKPDELLAKVLEADLASMVRRNPQLLAMALRARLVNRQTIRRAAKNASAHYDIGNDLYERMLDKRMIYSCAYWRESNDLESAQEAKLDLICQKLELEPGMRLLDIGCGWGGLSQHAAERYGVHVTGVSPAAEQVAVATERCVGLDIDIRQMDFRDVRGTFDRIVSVGMLEHVGPKNFRRFFDANAELLADGGIILHHTIGSNRSRNYTDPWFDKYIFPGGVIPSIAHIGNGAGEKWVVEDVHNFGPDYDTTLMAWYHNIEKAWGEIPHYDEHFRRTWKYYLLGSAAAFRVRNLQLWQVVLRRSRRASGVYQAVR
ncbi:MAG: cyclopropane fatty acyl phospholipid synthase [Actinomycetia bacterium]|nr:cyclopropane fatty acyl phospholipid synthase [Actinomycetes bacterium]MCP5031544.1 cyclopropane fatty acyl phospholipid synthase [Actinomycetes bacterium]